MLEQLRFVSTYRQIIHTMDDLFYCLNITSIFIFFVYISDQIIDLYYLSNYDT